jgi:hypothetical protein
MTETKLARTKSVKRRFEPGVGILCAKPLQLLAQ